MRMGRHARDMDFPASKVHEKQHRVRHEPTERPDLSGEEVGGHQHIHMCADELFPRRRGLALRRRWETMALENVPHRLITHSVSQVCQSPDDAVIAPGAILLGHADNQGLESRVYFGTAWGLALRRAVEFLRHQPAVPGENGVRGDDGGDFLESLLAELLADFSQCLAFAVRQLHTTSDLVAQEAILCHQVLIAQQQCLIDGSRDIRQQVFPVHPLSPATWAVYSAGEYP